MMGIFKFYSKIFVLFIHFFAFELSSKTQFPEITNLLFSNDNFEIINDVNYDIPTGNKETFNRYIKKNRKKDPRFININYRENGIDISQKILFLKKKSEIIFKFKFSLNHKLHYKLSKNSKIRIKLNEKILMDNHLSLREIN